METAKHAGREIEVISMTLNDALRIQMLTIHCADLATVRMRITLLEAENNVLGWNSDLICKWRDYNEELIQLGMKTRSLLAF